MATTTTSNDMYIAQERSRILYVASRHIEACSMTGGPLTIAECLNIQKAVIGCIHNMDTRNRVLISWDDERMILDRIEKDMIQALAGEGRKALKNIATWLRSI